MKIVFFGLGSIGSRYVRILLDNYNVDVYSFPRTMPRQINRPRVPEITNWSEFEDLKPDVSFITNPTACHIDTAIKCAEYSSKLFIEKPLGHSLDRLSTLLDVVNKKHLVTYVAYNLRFHPVIQELKRYLKEYHFLHMRIYCSSYLPDWRPGRDHKNTYSAQSGMGGGVLLDLSHELDYTQYLLGEILKAECIFNRAGDLTVDAEDFADLLLETKSGCANIHISFMSNINERVIRLDFKELSVIADLQSGELQELSRGKITQKSEYRIDRDGVYKKQIDYFFQNIDNPRMMNNVFESEKLLKILIKLKRTKNYHA